MPGEAMMCRSHEKGSSDDDAVAREGRGMTEAGWLPKNE
jgi:hypothetical protein